MKLTELIEKIENNSFEKIFLVLQNSDSSSSYITNQYIHSIANSNHLEIKYIDSPAEIADSGFIEDDNLYIIRVDKLDSVEEHDRLIYICNKTNYKEAVKIPKLEHWQFVDYLTQKVPGLNKSDLEWLITQYEVTDSRITETNYFRLDNDLDKVAIFDPVDQEQIFNKLYELGEYNTTSNLTVFDLTKALIQRDTKTALQVLKVYPYIDSKPDVWILSILLGNLKRIIGIQMGTNPTPESLGISEKQFYVIKKYSVNKRTNAELINLYEMLTELEYKYKFGGLSTDKLADYIVCKFLE